MIRTSPKDQLIAIKEINDRQLYRIRGCSSFMEYVRRYLKISLDDAAIYLTVANAFLESPHIDDLLVWPISELYRSAIENRDEVFRDGVKAIRPLSRHAVAV